jgi:hypothetical protein
MDFVFSILNNSKLFSGCVMLVMNLGARHIAVDVPKNVDTIFKHPLARLFLVFSVVFVSTRDVKTSILITLIFILFFKFLLDERSKSCIVPKKKDITNITPEQVKYAKEILKKYEEQNIKSI